MTDTVIHQDLTNGMVMIRLSSFDPDTVYTKEALRRLRVRSVTKYHREMVALVRSDWDLQAHREYYNRITKDNIQAVENFKGNLTSAFFCNNRLQNL